MTQFSVNMTTATTTGRSNIPNLHSITLIALGCFVIHFTLFGWKPRGLDLDDTKTSTVRCSSSESYQTALEESFGYFDDITDEQWQRKKNWLQEAKHGVSPPANPSKKSVTPQMMYTNHWNPDFACPFSSAIGPVGDGHKWICDPHRLRNIQDCLVYSVGSHGMFGFEQGLLKVAPNCEIHIFDPGEYTEAMKNNHVNASYHSWGLTSNLAFTESLKTNKGDREAIKYKDIHEIMRLLGHQDRIIHIFKIDCEGCEWDSYTDWMKVDIRQVQIETHGWKPQTFKFFEDMREAGFAMFSKEANTLALGRCVEFSFLKLKSSFFQS